MVRRHPALSVVTSAYGVAMVVFALVPWRGYDAGAGIARTLGAPNAGAVIDATANLLLFVPFGVLVSTFTGPRRRLGALVVVVLGACWVELAQMVWVPQRNPSVACMLAQCLGGVIGVVAVALTARGGRRSTRTVRARAEMEPTVPRA